ncbi:MAG: competence/damage-inducible protein cinA [Mycobacterium sp.]|nr:competence/damage-inducible protein cinA [Mycobacterium sp.]
MRAELLAVGDELLFGDIVNGNAAYLGRQLADVGVTVTHSAVVGDDIETIADALRAALARADAVLLTGGIGPTQDDLTREGLALAAGVELHRDDFLESQLRRRFREMRRGVPDMNYRQADLPVGAEPLPNERGTAPGIRLELLGGIAYAMPGVPHEMQAMFTHSVLPDLLRRAGEPAVVVHRVLHTSGMWESAVAEAMGPEVERLAATGVRNPTIAFLASGGQTRVRISARAANRTEAEKLIAPIEAFGRQALGEGLYGIDDDTLEGVVHRLLLERGETVAVAESLTGGLLAGRLTSTPGASDTFRGGIVAYSAELKDELLATHAVARGAVTEETAKLMASGVRERLGATWGLATTGVAGPTESERQPVGTLYVGIAGPTGVQARHVQLPGDREFVRLLSVVQGLDLLRRALQF